MRINTHIYTDFGRIDASKPLLQAENEANIRGTKKRKLRAQQKKELIQDAVGSQANHALIVHLRTIQRQNRAAYYKAKQMAEK